MVLGFLKGLVERILGRAAPAEEAVSAMAGARATLGAAIEETAYAGYRALTYAPPEEELYFPSTVHPHSVYAHSWEDLPTNYQSTYAADVWDDETGEWGREYFTIQHDDLLSDEDEEEMLGDMAEESLGARSAWGSLEFVGGKTRWPEYSEF